VNWNWVIRAKLQPVRGNREIGLFALVALPFFLKLNQASLGDEVDLMPNLDPIPMSFGEHFA
jgi:hypothetical protein